MNRTLPVAWASVLLSAAMVSRAGADPQRFLLHGQEAWPRFDGIGVVNGGGATSVLLKDYPEPQRSQILDLVFKPKFGASVSALLVEIPGDGNSTQGSMPSHMHTQTDLDYTRGYTWWILSEAKRRNPALSLDATAWSAPGWIGNGRFWSQDAADYYVKWLEGLRSVYGLELDAIGCRNEKGVSIPFAVTLRRTLNANGFTNVRIHAFDNWPKDKFDFVKDILDDPEASSSIDILSAHTLNSKDPKGIPVTEELLEMDNRLGDKPIWNTEEHVYKKGFDCAISIVQAFNDNYIHSHATRIVNWYDIAGLYPLEPYSEDPSMLLARSPWSGHYDVRKALWGYAHYGQFTAVGWKYLDGGCKDLAGGGSVVSMKSPGDDYSIIIETKDAKQPQELSFRIAALSAGDLCVWRSDAQAQFVRQETIKPTGGTFTITVKPGAIYSLSTTTGQQKGSSADVPADRPFPFPYDESFDGYGDPKTYGHLPHYTADIAGAFELVERPAKDGMCLRQTVPARTISWAPDWQPYTILGDDQWRDYEVSADVYLNANDAAGVMGRINDVGSGYGFIPKGYVFELSDAGEGRLVVMRGKKDKKKPVGDAEQQATIKASGDDGEGGDRVLARTKVADVAAGQWHRLALRFDGTSITGSIDDKVVLTATDSLYARGMAGLLAGGDQERLSTPYFDNLSIHPLHAPTSRPATDIRPVEPLYPKH